MEFEEKCSQCNDNATKLGQQILDSIKHNIKDILKDIIKL